jgi:hypothetical protein
MFYNYRYKNYKELYFHYLPRFFDYTTLFGGLVGCTTITRLLLDERVNPFITFIIPIGYSGIGMVVGITYPISFPLIGGYVLYKSLK